MALPVQKGNVWQRFGGLLTYNVGRALSYAMLGAVVGAFGNAIAMMGYLRYVSVFAGLFMLGYVFVLKLSAGLVTPIFLQKFVNQLKKRMSTLLRSRSLSGWFMLGTLNGLLPCGLVYLALVSSLATGTSLSSAVFMFVFGMGTLPAMMAVGFFKNWITPAVRSKFHQVTPVFIAFAGVWLLYRSTLMPAKSADHSGSAHITVCHGK